MEIVNFNRGHSVLTCTTDHYISPHRVFKRLRRKAAPSSASSKLTVFSL